MDETITIGYSLKHVLEAMPNSLDLVREGDNILVKTIMDPQWYAGIARTANGKLYIRHEDWDADLVDCEKVILIDIKDNIRGV